MTKNSTVKKAEIDPYYKWLGIPKNRRPPTYFDLLGLPANESDKETIEIAASRQSAIVNKFRGGDFEEWAARITYELEEARICLLDPQIRLQYRELLKRRKEKKQKNHALSSPEYVVRHTVGEEHGITKTFAGVMSVILICMLLAAGSSYMLPWWKPSKRDVIAAQEAPRPEKPVEQKEIVENNRIPKHKPPVKKPISDPFVANSVWTGVGQPSDKKPVNLRLRVVERSGDSFKAILNIGDKTVNEIKGNIIDGKVKWSSDDVRTIKGPKRGATNTGMISKTNDGHKIVFRFKGKKGNTGTYELHLN